MPMLRLQQEKRTPQPGKLKMFGHLGHLGHLTPKPQQNRPFFNLSNMANHKTLAILPLATPTTLPPRSVDCVVLLDLDCSTVPPFTCSRRSRRSRLPSLAAATGGFIRGWQTGVGPV